MKLTAPPPPPPEPPQPGGDPPGEVPPGPADAAPPTDLPPLPPLPPPPPVAKPAVWPQWYSGADTVLVALAVGLAFLVASFAARNSDLWLHLGAGRMLTTGEYKLGSDPFSYTAADRPWVNHSWLFDLGAYLLYRGDGFALVLAKALAVAAAVGLLIGIRRPPHALWPWAAVAAVATVAAGPRLTLNPLVGSFFFLAVTLFLLFRVPSPPGSWRLPVAVGVTFWLWAGTDAWFFVGPLALALLLVGELVRTKGLNAAGPALPADDPLGPLPDVPTLAKALGVGLVACTLTPHHVRVWELPYELVGGPGTEDPRLAQLLTSPLTAQFWDQPGLGSNANGLALAVLLLGGLYAVALGGVVARLAGRPWDVEPLPLPHSLLWCGLAALALKTIFAVPFLAAVSVPLLASRLNAVSARVDLGTAADSRTRLALTLSSLGRAASVLGLLALGVCAWPGWLHPPVQNPAFARRVAWEVVPDPALARAAGAFDGWRAAGALGPDDRGFVASLDLANYLAWHAPGEKVFANGRYAHHRAEWAAYAKARQGLGLIQGPEGVGPRDADVVFDAQGVSHVAVSVSAGDGLSTRAVTREASRRMWADPDGWAAWYLDGRTAVCGRRVPGAAPRHAFDRLRVDPVALAFGPAAGRLPAGPVEPVPPPRTWESDFTRPARPAPPAADEALAWMEYKEVLIATRYVPAYQAAALLLRAVPATAAPPVAGNLYQLYAESMAAQRSSPHINPEDGSLRAVPVLALKAARTAVADNPDHPDGYFALARVLNDTGLPVGDSERSVGMVTALRQCLSRLPPPEEFVPGVYAASPTQAAQELASLYAGNYLRPGGGVPGVPVDLPGLRELAGMLIRTQGGQVVPVPFQFPVDLAHEAMAQAAWYAEREIEVRPTDPPQRREFREQVLKGLKQQADRLQAARQQATDQYRRDAELKPAAKDRFDAALRARLTGEAIRVVKELPGPDLEREFGPDLARKYLQVVGLETAVGRVEDAAGDLEGLKDLFDKQAAQPQPPQAVALGRAYLRAVEQQLLLLTGNYEAAGRELEATEGAIVAPGALPPGVGLPPPRWPAVAAVPSLNTTVGLAMFGLDRQAEYGQVQQVVFAWKRRESEFFFRRGLLALLEGDVEGARVRFREAVRPAVPQWDVPEIGHAQAAQYLRMIDAVARR